MWRHFLGCMGAIAATLPLGIGASVAAADQADFKVDCGSAVRPVVALDAGTVCLGVCAAEHATVGCVVAARQFPPNFVPEPRTIGLEIRGRGITTRELGRHLETVLGWKVEVAEELAARELPEMSYFGPWDRLGTTMFRYFDQGAFRIEIDRERKQIRIAPWKM